MMNHRPLLSLLTLVIAVTGAVFVVLFLAGMPAEAFAATPPTTPPQTSEHQSATMWLSGLGVALWMAARGKR